MKMHEIQQLSLKWAAAAPDGQAKSMQEVLRAMGLDPGELYQELEMTSRFVDTHRDESVPGSRVNLHSHSFYEVLYCRSSCGTEYLVGSERYRLQRGDIIIVAPGVSHMPILPENMPEPYRRYVLWISAAFAQSVRELFPVLGDIPGGGAELVRTAGTRWEFLGDLFRSGVQMAESGAEDSEAMVVANTLTLMVQLRRAIYQDGGSVLRAERPELLDQVMAYVEKNLHRKLTLAEVARQFYVSESTVSQMFRQRLGISFHRCITQRRLIAAKLLIEGEELLEDVGQKVGFADYSAFYRAFRQEYGISPRQYRKRSITDRAGAGIEL